MNKENEAIPQGEPCIEDQEFLAALMTLEVTVETRDEEIESLLAEIDYFGQRIKELRNRLRELNYRNPLSLI